MENKPKFGFKQLKNPTPASYDRFVKMYVGIMGIFLAWMPTNNLVSHHVQDIVTPVANLLNSVFIFLLPYFGVEIDTKKVLTSDVEVIENNSNQ